MLHCTKLAHNVRDENSFTIIIQGWKMSIIRVVCMLSGSLWVLPLAAFGPDLCLLTTGELTNCTPLPAECPAGDASSDCVVSTAAASGVVSEETDPVGGKRSMVHMDFTFFAAQFIGFGRNPAYFIAAYDDATDLGRYVPRSATGKLLADPDDCDAGIDNGRCKWITRPLAGINKVNITTGGLFFHFHAPYNKLNPTPPANLDGMHPDTDAASSELFLSHLRRWADPSGGVSLMCAHGITDNSGESKWDYAYGSQCYGYDGSTSSALITGLLNVTEAGAPTPVSVPYVVQAGPQVLHYNADGTTVNSENFDTYIGDKAKWARIGIYLHAYQDRVSHYRCGDDSYIVGPYSGTPVAFVEDMSTGECDQQLHIIRHAWETGTDQSQLAEQDRTLEAGLRGSFEELLAIAVNMGKASDRALDPAQKEAFLTDMLTVLQIPNAYERMMTMASVGVDKYGLGEMPGY